VCKMKNPRHIFDSIVNTIVSVVSIPAGWMSHHPRDGDVILMQAGIHDMNPDFDRKRELLANGNPATGNATGVNPKGLIGCLVANDPLPLIEPNDRNLQRWNLLLLSFIAFNLLVVPFDLSFGMDKSGFLAYTSHASDVVFLVDIVVTLHVKLVVHFQLDEFVVGQRDTIAKQYLYGNFWIDLLSIGIPFDAVDLGFNGFGLFKMLRLFRAVRILKKIIKVSPDNEAIIHIFSLILCIMYVSHVVACLFWASALVSDNSKNNAAPRSNWHRDGRVDLTEMTSFEQYWTANYWAVMTISTVGYGDVSAANEYEMFFSMVVMVAGAIFYAVVQGSVSSAIDSISNKSRPYTQRVRLLEKFIADYQVHSSVANRLRTTTSLQWKLHGPSTVNSFLGTLQPHLARDVQMNVYRPLLIQVPFLAGKDDMFTAQLVLQMEPHVILGGDWIYRVGDMGRELHVVSRGQCVLFAESTNLEDSELNRKFASGTNRQASFSESLSSDFTAALMGAKVAPDLDAEDNKAASQANAFAGVVQDQEKNLKIVGQNSMKNLVKNIGKAVHLPGHYDQDKSAEARYLMNLKSPVDSFSHGHNNSSGCGAGGFGTVGGGSADSYHKQSHENLSARQSSMKNIRKNSQNTDENTNVEPSTTSTQDRKQPTGVFDRVFNKKVRQRPEENVNPHHARRFSTDLPVVTELGVEKGEISLLRKGASFGIHCILPPHLGKRCESARALTNCEILALDREKLMGIADFYPVIRHELLLMAAESKRKLLLQQAKLEDAHQRIREEQDEEARKEAFAGHVKHKKKIPKSARGHAKGFFKHASITLDVIKATGLASKDTSGLSDPYAHVLLDYCMDEDPTRLKAEEEYNSSKANQASAKDVSAVTALPTDGVAVAVASAGGESNGQREVWGGVKTQEDNDSNSKEDEDEEGGSVGAMEPWSDELKMAAKSAHTRFLQKTVNPQWHDTFRLPVSNSSADIRRSDNVEDFGLSGEDAKTILSQSCGRVTVSVWDRDRLSADDFLGQVVVLVKDLPPNKPVLATYVLGKRGKNDHYAGHITGTIQLRLLLQVSGFHGVGTERTAVERLKEIDEYISSNHLRDVNNDVQERAMKGENDQESLEPHTMGRATSLMYRKSNRKWKYAAEISRAQDEVETEDESENSVKDIEKEMRNSAVQQETPLVIENMSSPTAAAVTKEVAGDRLSFASVGDGDTTGGVGIVGTSEQWDDIERRSEVFARLENTMGTVEAKLQRLANKMATLKKK